MSTSRELLYEKGLAVPMSGERQGPVLEAMLERLHEECMDYEPMSKKALVSEAKFVGDLAERTILNLIADLKKLGLVTEHRGRLWLTGFGKVYVKDYFEDGDLTRRIWGEQ